MLIFSYIYKQVGIIHSLVICVKDTRGLKDGREPVKIVQVSDRGEMVWHVYAPSDIEYLLRRNLEEKS